MKKSKLINYGISNTRGIEIASSNSVIDTFGTAYESYNPPELSDKEIGFICESQDGSGSANRNGVSTGNINASTGDISGLLPDALPTTRRGQTRRCYHHYQSDDLLQTLIDIKVDFTQLGMNLQVRPPVNAEPGKEDVGPMLEQLDKISIEWNILKLVEDLLRDYYLTDSMILYWRTNPNKGISSEGSIPTEELISNSTILEISAINPGDVDWNNSIGQNILTIDINPALEKQIKDALTYGSSIRQKKSDTYKGLMDQGIPSKWIEAVDKGKKNVELKEIDGDHWIINTKTRGGQGLCNPSMYSIFLSLESRKLLCDGEFSTSLMMKHFIQLIKQGESVESGPLAGTRRNWINNTQATALLRNFSTVNKAIRLAVNHTTKIEFIFPPKEMFDRAKFESIEHRIFVWNGVTAVLVTGAGAEYAGGYLSIKRLIAKIKNARNKMSDVFMKFFNHETIRPFLRAPDGYMVKMNFDENALTEPRQLLEEVKFLFENSISDQRTALRELGRDPEQVKLSTIQSQKEQEALSVWSGVGDQGKKVSSGNPEGRPANNDTTLSEETRTQYPSSQT